MARLPSERYVMQQIGDDIILWEDGSEREIVRYKAGSRDATALAQKAIYDSELNDEDKCFAYFWSGYFHAYAAIVGVSR